MEAPDAKCNTCRFARGLPSGHQWCQREANQHVTNGYGCGWWEREPGSDDQFQTAPAIHISRQVHAY